MNPVGGGQGGLAGTTNVGGRIDEAWQVDRRTESSGKAAGFAAVYRFTLADTCS
jgi:hypothetical protein